MTLKHLLLSILTISTLVLPAQNNNPVLLIDKNGLHETFIETGEYIGIKTKGLMIRGLVTEIDEDSVYIDSISIAASDIIKLNQIVYNRETSFKSGSSLVAGGILLMSGVLLSNTDSDREKILSTVSIAAGLVFLTRGIYSLFDRKIFKVKNGYIFKTAVINKTSSQ